MIPPKPVSISKAISTIKRTLDFEVGELYVIGEVTNLKKSAAGHVYFSLTDGAGLLNCALFKMDAFRNPIVRGLKDGDKIECIGRLDLYPARGSLQIIAKRISLAGKGDLKEQFELLKKKLAAEGLFDESSKKEVPAFAKNIAVVTGLGAAAFEDFKNIYKRRSNWMNLILVPSLVQGERAPLDLIRAIEKVEAYNSKNAGYFDCIVLTRGGGSLEDLWAFNDENLVRKIHECQIPIISAVGHQIDFTLCDFVSDIRCETPSAAAEYLTKGQVEILDKFLALGKRLGQSSKLFLMEYKELLSALHPNRIVDILRRKLHAISSRLTSIHLFSNPNMYLKLNQHNQKLDEALVSLNECPRYLIKDKLKNLESLKSLLNALSPNKVLERGYCIASAQEDILMSYKDFKRSKNINLKLKFHDGEGHVSKQQ